MRVHVLKSWPEFFDAQASGAKTFEIRKNDRNFEVGDVLILRQWDPASGGYVPGVLGRRVTYLSTQFLPEGTCAMSTAPLSDDEWRESLTQCHFPDEVLEEILELPRGSLI